MKVARRAKELRDEVLDEYLAAAAASGADADATDADDPYVFDLQAFSYFSAVAEVGDEATARAFDQALGTRVLDAV